MVVTTREVETGPRRRILWWVAAAAVLVAVGTWDLELDAAPAEVPSHDC